MAAIALPSSRLIDAWRCRRERQQPKVGFLFPGQGSQRVNMARTLVERFDWARDLVAKADSWLEEVGVGPVSGLIYHDTDQDLDGEQQKRWMRALTQTEVAQPAICLASLLWLELMHRLGLNPSAVGGHSLGELTAFHAAGALDQKSVLQLAALRGRLMGKISVEGSMASLSCPPTEARELIEWVNGYVVIANVNSPTQTVVSGDVEAVAAAIALATERGIRARELPVSAAFHSAHFSETVTELRDLPQLRGTATASKARLYSTMTGGSLDGPINLSQHFSEQVVKAVNFRSVAALAGSDCDVLLEVGPGAVLSGLTNETTGVGGTLCLPLESKARRDQDLNIALGYLHILGAEIDLAKLSDQRLIRRFRSAAELSFFVNPCEKPVLDADVIATIDAEELDRAQAERSRKPVSHIRALSPDSARVIEDTGRAGAAGVSPHVNARAVVLDALHTQTGFPVETLTDELQLVDDLHLDSIKTVELVSEAADRLGISEAFDAAQFAEVTLGELIERMERLEANAAPGDGESADGAARAERLGEAGNPWVASFALHWEEEPLDRSIDVNLLTEGRTLVLAPDANDAFVVKLVQELTDKGVDAHTREAVNGSVGGTSFDHLLVVYPDTGAPSAIEELSQVVELLTRAARELPSTGVKKGRPSCVAWIRARAGGAERNAHYDWSADAFAATVHLERRKLRVRSLEFACASRQGARIADTLFQELADEQPFVSARYDADGRRFVGTPRLQHRASYAPRATSISADDVVLVTGGAKGITAQCALALARETRATMVLVGSSRAPDAKAYGLGADEIRATLSKFEAEGLRSHYMQCDLAVREDVERLVAAVRKDFGSVDVVVHGAGLNRPRRVEEPDVSEVIDEIAPKLSGALHLFDVLEDVPPKMFVALTSVIGVVGMAHNGWYAFANQSLDRSLGQFAARHPSVEVVSLAYSIWDEVGMGAKLGSIKRLSKLGVDPIPVEEGVARFLELINHDPGVQEVILTGSLGSVDTWRPKMPELPRAHRFIDRILTLEPGRELVCRTTLDLERDPYVRDHVYEGSHLLPAVFGLEAMAEAVAYVTGRAELPFPLTVENVELNRPLIVHPDRGLLIEIQARVEETEPGSGVEQRVHAEIRSKQTGFEQAHFSARFELGAATTPRKQTDEISIKALPIEPTEHLYGSVLFQGPRFQRIEDVYALDAKSCRFSATQGFAGEQESWLLGDPYFRDALLQSLQLCVVPDQCLPVRIDRWEIAEPAAARPSNRLCKAVIDGRDGDTYVGTISAVSAEGLPIETLGGYHARTLVRRLEWPGPEELALRGSQPVAELDSMPSSGDARTRVNELQSWDGGVFYRDVPGYGHEGQSAFFSRFPLTAQDASSPSGSLNPSIYFRWTGKLREMGVLNTEGVYKGLLEMLGSNEVMSATNDCETRILKVPLRNDLIEGRYWMECVNRGDAGEPLRVVAHSLPERRA